MILTTGRVDEVLVVRPELSRLDASVAVTFKERVGELILQGDRRLVLDLARVEFLDSSGLGVLVALLKRTGGEGALALAGLRPAVSRLLQLTRLDRVFGIHDTVEQAAAAIAGG